MGWVAALPREQIMVLISRVLRVFATLWLAWTLAGLVWLAVGRNAANIAAPAPVRRAQPAVDVSRLAALNLFGSAAVVQASGAAATAPDTSLQLRLTGVFVNAAADQSSAIVTERNNPSAPAKVYQVREALPGGATLAEVYDDRILIRRSDGKSEVLRFEKTSLLNTVDVNTGLPVADNSPRALIGSALQEMASSPEQFLQKMGLKRGSGGYEVTANTPESMRSASGLQAGDKIISVNGRRLGNPLQDQGALMALKNSASAKIEIQRGTQVITLERKF